MTNAELNQMQMAVLMPILNPFIDIIVERVSERVLSATMQKNRSFTAARKRLNFSM